MSRLSKYSRAGIYFTVSIHLAVLIVLLLCGLGTTLRREESFVLDFSKLDQLEQLRREVAFKEEISRRLEQAIAEGGNDYVRAVAVDRAALRDDRGTDAQKLYEDAARLQEELSRGFEVPEEEGVVMQEKAEVKKDRQEKTYSGPSVISYELEGRKASKLPIPAYRCIGAGEVKVLIKVNNRGDVVDVRVDEASSSKDACLRNFAIRAARMSKFSISQTAPSLQAGNIVYQFVAQ